MGGPAVEDLGSYNPFSKTIAFKQERISHWMGIGAKPTVTVHNLLVKQGFVTGPKIKISIPKAEVKPGEEKAAEAPAEAAPEVSAEQPAA